MVYLIDYENVGSIGLNGLDKLTKEDTVVLFFSEKAHTVDIEVIDFFNKAKCEIKYYKTKKSMPNYLDFHISTIAGAYLIQGESVAIVSKDKGYVSVIDYWKSDFLFGKSQTVQLNENISKIKPVRVQEKTDNTEIKNAKETKIREETGIRDNLNMAKPTDIKVQEIIKKSKNLNILKYNLINEFSRIEGLRLYEEIAPSFSKIKSKPKQRSKGR